MAQIGESCARCAWWCGSRPAVAPP